MVIYMTLTAQIKAKALALGFDMVGISRAVPPPLAAFLPLWLDRGYHGEMGWMASTQARRLDPCLVVPGAQSVISLATNYYTEGPTTPRSSDVGVISRYAWGDDYHELIIPRLRALYDYLRTVDSSIEGRYYVDTGPVMEKAFAQQAGLGWIGKHTNVITEPFGSWVFLSEIIINQPLEYDLPQTDQCGHCTLCIDACPTGAIVAPYVLDARRCIPYLTIELRSDIPEALRPRLDNHLFGCDICQDVCPWNSRPVTSSEPAFQPRPEQAAPALDALIAWDEDHFRRAFRNSPVKRTKWIGFLRNLMVAFGNSRNSDLAPSLRKFLDHIDARIRRHALWALDRLTPGSPPPTAP